MSDQNQQAQRKLKWSDFDTTLRGEYLGDKTLDLTIERIAIEKVFVDNKKVDGPVAYFKETRLKLPLSLTNRRFLSQVCGNSAESCIGRVITVEAVPMEVGGKAKLPVRIIAVHEPRAETKTETKTA